MATIKDPLKVAVGELGNTESPAGSNRTKYGKWMGLDGYAWCMSFVQWCFDQAGRPLPHKTGSCSDLLSWFQKYAPGRIATTPRPRDIVIYTFGHTGILESAAASTVTVIEGNTSPGSSGSQDNGGGVYRRTRSKSLVKAYIRAFDNYEEDDIMTGKEIIANLTDAQAYELLTKAQRHADTLRVPTKSQAEYQEAVRLGITDGANPCQLVPRWQAALMAKRAMEKKA